MTHESTSRRTRRWAVVALAAFLATGQVSCAATGLVPDASPMPAARAGLRPEYRIFYDSLVEYGEWILIEPFGWVFRPRVSRDIWNPYWDGFWSPTDLYGWVWMSAEPFGWATYHYGRWFQDPYQGWVWVPGLDWAPAWVTWDATDQYVGWAPLAPGSVWTSSMPATTYQFAARRDLGSPDLKSRLVKPEEAATLSSEARPVENLGQADGVTVNRGPRIDWVEQVAGPLKRAKIEDLVVPQSPATLRGRAGTGDPPAVENPEAETKQAAGEATRRTRTMIQQKQTAPETLPVVRPFGPPGRAGEPAPAPAKPAPQQAGPKKGAPADSAR